MNLSEICIRRPVLAWMIMFGLITFGVISFQRMGISQMPDVNFPVINIALTLDNAAPEIMESDVIDLIEDAVMGIEGLKAVTSTASQGVANVTCEFSLEHDIDIALQEVANRIDQVRNRLPQKLYPPVITKTNPEDLPIVWVMVSADDRISVHDQMIYARNTLKDQLSSLKGVGDIQFGGYVTPNLRVWIDQQKLRYYSLTAADIVNTITNEQLEEPAGRIESPDKEINIRVLGEARSIAEFEKINITTRGGSPNFTPIPLTKVARIEESVADIRALSRYNGAKAVGLGVIKQHGSNAVQVAQGVREKVAQMTKSLPKGLSLDVRLDSTHYIKESVAELNFTLLLSAILTAFVCLLFLGSWSSTINVLLAVPMSIIGAFIALYFFGFTLNTFTLLGLSLAIGIVVDDAIMMLENIVRHRDLGKSKIKAAIDGSAEISFAAIAATLAIAAIFIPVIFMEGVIGAYFYQYGITVTVAVFLSLLEALALTPMFSSNFMQSHSADKEAKEGWMDHMMNAMVRQYRQSIEVLLRFRWPVILLSVLLFAASLMLLNRLPQELIPKQDQSLYLINIKTPPGTSIWATDEVFKKAESYLKTQPEVADLYTTIGNFGGNDIVNAGSIYVILKEPKERRLNQSEIMAATKRGLRDLLAAEKADVFTQDLSLTGFSASRGYPVEFTLIGPDWQKLISLSKTLRQRIEEAHILEDINSTFQDGMPQIQVKVDRNQAAERGVSIVTLGTELAALLGGQVFGAQTQYPKNGHRYDIRIRSLPNQHDEPSDVQAIQLRNNRGTAGDLVSIQDVSHIKTGESLQLIARHNRQRAVPFFANIAPGLSQKTALKAIENIAAEVLPPGYQVVITGSAQAFLDAFASLMFALILGVIVAYMILASQFNSFIHPVTVLMALPFSLTGALIALYGTGQSLNLFSMIGLILLMGIVKKNSILLVDFTKQKRDEGLSPTQALIAACPLRLRPILMTSVATVAGAIPPALALGPGAETRVPMAIAIIGGVTVSTVLTLFVVPCVYSVFSHVERPDPVD